MKPTKEEISYAKHLLKKAGYIVHLFHKEDIRSAADEKLVLTDSEVDEVASLLENVDANVGINWDTINVYIEKVVERREECLLKYEVQMFTICDGWVNTWLVEEDGISEPETFNSLTDAWHAVFEFIEETNDEIVLGQREPDNSYDITDFRVEPVKSTFQP